MTRALVTGGAGFIGSNIADRLAALGCEVVVFDSLVRPGAAANLAWLQAAHGRRIAPSISDLRDADAVRRAVADADVVFHLAGQVAVTTSLSAPADDFAVNLAGTFTLLDAVRKRSNPPPVLFASTNKVYGDLAAVPLQEGAEAYTPSDPAAARFGVSEAQTLDFRTPYGCSKGAADQYVLDFARSFGVPACVLRMSCVYGRRQMGSEDQGWVAHFARAALSGAPLTLYGDGKQVRDVLDVRDAVDVYLAAWRRIGAATGRAFNLGGGPDNAVSLRAVLTELADITGRPLHLRHGPWRPGDQRWYVSDIRAISGALDLAPPRDWKAGLADLVDWLRTPAPATSSRRRAPAAAEARP